MRTQIISNLFSSLIERGLFIASQFIVGFLMIRFLPIEEYGVTGVAAGYFVIITFFNVGIENILLRDHLKMKERIDHVLYSLLVVSALKALMIALFFVLLIPYLNWQLGHPHTLWGIGIVAMAPIIDCLAAPLIIYATSVYKQKLVTQITFIRAAASILLTTGVIFFPTLKFLFLKEVVVTLFYLAFLYYYLLPRLGIHPLKKGYSLGVDWSFIKKTLFGYAIWVHCISAITFFIYRSDTVFLSFFVDLEHIGYYNIALASANVVNILPQLLSYQNSIAISHIEDHNRVIRMTNTFVRISFYVGIVTLITAFFLGKPYLYLLKGGAIPDETYTNMLYIIISLLIAKTIVSPYNSYITIKGDVKALFYRVVLPTGLATSVLYFFSAMYGGTQGIALANIVAALIWLGLQLTEMRRYDYHLEGLFNWRSDLQFLRSLSFSGII